MQSMNKAATIDHRQAAETVQHPQALLELAHGKARQSLLTVHGILEATLPAGELSIYEAGGGSTSFLPLKVLHRAHVTVVDIDQDQIRNNDYAQQAILGDIQTYRFKPNSFDLVICYNVIEHVPDVEAALLNFRESLKPNGMILIGAPNPRSLSGVVTKYSPHWFHVWFYRHVRGDKKAGLPGHAPFPTLFHPLVALPNLEAFAEQHGSREPGDSPTLAVSEEHGCQGHDRPQQRERRLHQHRVPQRVEVVRHADPEMNGAQDQRVDPDKHQHRRRNDNPEPGIKRRWRTRFYGCRLTLLQKFRTAQLFRAFWFLHLREHRER
jgi:SAM-dependent methyltransferase